MEEKEILSVSLASLMKMHPPQQGVLYYDGCILGHRYEVKSETVMNLFRFPTRINAFGTVLCSKGSLVVNSNLSQRVIGPKMIFLCTPGSIVQVKSHEDAEVYFILCEEDFINRVQIDQKQLIHLFMATRETPSLKLNDSEWEEIIHSINEIFSEGHKQLTDVISTGIMYSLFRLTCYRICRAIEARIDKLAQDSSNAHVNRNTAYFNTFLEELSKHYMQERSVGFYAERLHLTPKYLTTLLRTTTGRTASEWIDEYVVLEAKNLLKYSTMNIQEIAYYLNFPNQSFFGRYFKQHTGMSPTSYRTCK